MGGGWKLVVGGLWVAAALLSDAAGPGDASASPGVPDAPSVLFGEDFENSPAPATAVTSYHGAPPLSQTYTTDPAWAADTASCNGWIVAFADPGVCEQEARNVEARTMARKLGILSGDPTPDDNHAVAGMTDLGHDPGANAIELQSVTPVAVPAGGRFLIFSADVAESKCSVGGVPALLAFFLRTGADEIPLTPAPVDVCTTADLGDGVNGGRITSDGALLFSGPDLRVVLRNGQASGIGNDSAFDNIAISDASPQLDKAFGSGSIVRGHTTALTFTVTNTSELGAKNGWAFTDALAAGLRVAGPSGASTTCPAGVVTAAPGGASIAATGNLAAGQASCTVTVNVVGVQAGAASNGAGQLATVGLRRPASPATLTVTEPPPVAPLALCARGALALTDVHRSGRHTVLRGVAGPDAVGAQVGIYAASGKRVATATVGADQSFTATAPLPRKAIRDTNAARFQARLGAQRSLSLKFARRMTDTVARRLSPSRVQIGGRVTAPLARPVAPVLVRASNECAGQALLRARSVARKIRVARNGRWSATITLPSALRGSVVFLRAETRVRKTARTPNVARTFSLIQGVRLK